MYIRRIEAEGGGGVVVMYMGRGGLGIFIIKGGRYGILKHDTICYKIYDSKYLLIGFY